MGRTKFASYPYLVLTKSSCQSIPSERLTVGHSLGSPDKILYIVSERATTGPDFVVVSHDNNTIDCMPIVGLKRP